MITPTSWEDEWGMNERSQALVGPSPAPSLTAERRYHRSREAVILMAAMVHQQILIMPADSTLTLVQWYTRPKMPDKCQNGDQLGDHRSGLISEVVRDENEVREGGIWSWLPKALKLYLPWALNYTRLISPSCTAITDAFSQQRIWNLIVSLVLSPHSIGWPWK